MATIHEVARAAGVSASTVSRALSDSPLVEARTREAVLRAAADLGYVPNRAARGLVTGRTGNLGLVLPDLTRPGVPHLAKAIQSRARESDHAVFLVDTDDDPAAELAAVRALAKQVDGVILCSPRMSADDLRAATSCSPAVVVHRRADAAVTVDAAGGLRQAVAHLVALGHRRIGHVGARSRTTRLAASTTVDLVGFTGGPPRFEGGMAAADLVVAAGVTAVITADDLVAFGLMSRLATRGVRVPDDISVVGFGDLPIAATTTPALTTVAVPQDQVGRAAVDLLLHVLAGGRASRREIPAHLVVRASTAVRR